MVRHEEKIILAQLSLYPDPAMRKELFLAIGEVHNPRRPEPSPNPQWLIAPERGLFTGIAIFGAIGSGKKSGCIYPFAEQLLAYRAGDAEHRVAGLVLEVKSDFCHKLRGILEKHGRAGDYVKVSLGSPYRYNPLHNDLEAYAPAYGIASLLNNLFGRGKEPFWQQAYTNLVKFIILLTRFFTITSHCSTSTNAQSTRTNWRSRRSYNVQRDWVFEPKMFAELKNAQSIVLAYDGLNPMPPGYCIFNRII